MPIPFESGLTAVRTTSPYGGNREGHVGQIMVLAVAVYQTTEHAYWSLIGRGLVGAPLVTRPRPTTFATIKRSVGGRCGRYNAKGTLLQLIAPRLSRGHGPSAAVANKQPVMGSCSTKQSHLTVAIPNHVAEDGRGEDRTTIAH